MFENLILNSSNVLTILYLFFLTTSDHIKPYSATRESCLRFNFLHPHVEQHVYLFSNKDRVTGHIES